MQFIIIHHYSLSFIIIRYYLLSLIIINNYPLSFISDARAIWVEEGGEGEEDEREAWGREKNKRFEGQEEREIGENQMNERIMQKVS